MELSLYDKPPLNEATLIHFGIKGMKWGVRKKRDSVSTRRTVAKSLVKRTALTLALGSGAYVANYTIQTIRESPELRALIYKGAKWAGKRLFGEDSVKALGYAKLAKKGAEGVYRVTTM